MMMGFANMYVAPTAIRKHIVAICTMKMPVANCADSVIPTIMRNAKKASRMIVPQYVSSPGTKFAAYCIHSVALTTAVAT